MLDHNKRWLHQDVFSCCYTIFFCASFMLPGYDENRHLWIHNLLSDLVFWCLMGILLIMVELMRNWLHR
ncbi:hypothetical protein Hdeb2414_s0008g00276031 [Helianthus debilis subsp. tardiflorus]